MARPARAVVAGAPHHVTQRGNRRQQTFFSDEDYQACIDLMSRWCAKGGVEIRGRSFAKIRAYGPQEFLTHVEKALGRTFRLQKAGRKPKKEGR